MMLYPSIDNLLLKIDSKYSLVTVAAKRARYCNWKMIKAYCRATNPTNLLGKR